MQRLKNVMNHVKSIQKVVDFEISISKESLSLNYCQ